MAINQYLFDTNIYRDLTYDCDFDVAKSKLDSDSNFQPLLSTIVGSELICHLLDGNTKTRNNCYLALKLMNYHCKIQTDKGEKYNISPSYYDLITGYFLGTFSKQKNHNKAILDIIYKISKTDNYNQINESTKKEIQSIIEFKSDENLQIIDNIKEAFIIPLSSGGVFDKLIFVKNKELKEKFIKNPCLKQIVISSMINIALDEIKGNNEKLATNLIDNFSKHFEVSINYYLQNILNKVALIEKPKYFYNPSSDPRKRWNNFYDMQILFAAEYENSFNRKTYLVTTDEKMLSSTKKSNDSNFIIRFEELNNLKSR